MIDREYAHSVRLNKELCKGCTNCIKGCPTQAIRVRKGKARIIDERCIDCGECVRACEQHAKIAVTDGMEAIERFKYRIAIPAPSLYGQFKHILNPRPVLSALMAIGFDDVWEVARAADIVSEATRRLLVKGDYKKPLISSACPAVVRLIRVRFPSLIENLSHIDSPMEVAAQIAREEFCKKRKARPQDVGVFFITPCAAKMTSVMNPLGRKTSNVDGTISIIDVFGRANSHLGDENRYEGTVYASPLGVGWAATGGEGEALNLERHLSVDGIHNVIKMLEAVENAQLPEVEFIEALSCSGGCLGGPLTFENVYAARLRLQRMIKAMGGGRHGDIPQDIMDWAGDERIKLTLPIKQVEVSRLSDDIGEAIERMERMDGIFKRLPGLDCGSCGSPNCRTMAEDIVKGFAVELDCIFLLRDKVHYLAQEMVQLASGDQEKNSNKGEESK